MSAFTSSSRSRNAGNRTLAVVGLVCALSVVSGIIIGFF